MEIGAGNACVVEGHTNVTATFKSAEGVGNTSVAEGNVYGVGAIVSEVGCGTGSE